ncbi:bone marrow proteoglycan-like isoform X1 [Sinocyclocheilus anshuiensis]|uniref:bone marrow proteoglycan-like isoform X1 n=1 Tax=Sinocyclocheilus anshuiensis TaxID=1608454 RepID=UPI0007B7EE44|nr:PREDICTED: bone marrow proteoglycan-like isoform X1 [Sinocyclocheilus anshuiensis]XP_016350896.1 PREDICTED: bone marrow proteoglycan-like isoform X1 [Sinocyclocheilus anshuiensis]XP_016350898.1 PREDICTED: bone marrow proteoglycan-like isoform X1 [Sinocyclocheilus anshuiensis]XP_016350899.1 PREDICTED: bone marrow proteoglycan-like isoform X1 [Sinocyclocheilus anshuiensis]XP_016350900.1 PREDICTED: bone marrow proteoglycan-like isoform X1 [Sinocyclocheilus anshuiensis]XP_016350901.1 PREDICTED:
MRKLLLLVLTITASVASASPVQDEKLPDQVVKVPVVEKEPAVEHTEAEQGPLMQDEAVADSRMLEPDSVLLGPETTEEHRIPEETQVMLEEPMLEADYLTEEMPETELEPETEITAIQMNRNIIPVEEAVQQLESETNIEVKDEKKENVVKEEPTLEAEYIAVEDSEIQMELGRERRRTQNGRWTCRGVVLQGKCYQYFTRNLDAYTAELQCQSICPNGHLASVTSSYIRDRMGKLMDRYGGRTRAWLGGRRIIGTNNFVWLDGTQWSYNGWAFGEPNNAGGMENCMETWNDLTFSDVPCTIPKQFICSCPV